jgi:hypothetical protein
MALHVLLAWSIPVAVYATFGREYRFPGYYTALVVAFSMTPYVYLKFIHHDLAYMAFSMLSLCLLVEYLQRSRVGVLYGFLAALIATCLTRPAGNLLFLPLLALACVVRPAQWRHYLVVTAIFAVVLAAYSMHRTRVLGVTEEGTLPSYFGQQIYYNLYINSSAYGIAITPALGPATTQLVQKVRQSVAQHPLDSAYMQEWYKANGFSPQAAEFWFTDYAGQDERFISSLFQQPNADRFEYLCQVERNDHVFRKAAIEVLAAYPLYPFQYGLRNLWIFLWDPGVSHGRFGMQHDSFVREKLYFLPGGRSVAENETESLIAPPGRYELRQRGSAQLRPLLARIEKKWRSEKYRKINQIAASLAGIALPAALFIGGRFRWLVRGNRARLLVQRGDHSSVRGPQLPLPLFRGSDGAYPGRSRRDRAPAGARRIDRKNPFLWRQYPYRRSGRRCLPECDRQAPTSWRIIAPGGPSILGRGSVAGCRTRRVPGGRRRDWLF